MPSLNLVFQSIMKNLPEFSEVLELRTTTNNTERQRETERETLQQRDLQPTSESMQKLKSSRLRTSLQCQAAVHSTQEKKYNIRIFKFINIKNNKNKK